MDGALRSEIEEHCWRLEVPLIGFASADSWDKPRFEPWVPEPFRPASIVPGTRTVIVIGMPVFLPAVETAPSIWYHEFYRTINGLLDENAYRIAAALNTAGHPSVPVPRDGYGSFGVSNVLLTPAYGPRVRFASIFTLAEPPAGPGAQGGSLHPLHAMRRALPGWGARGRRLSRFADRKVGLR